MSLSWTDHTPQRPSRYLDWDLRNRPKTDRADYWCAVSLDLDAGHARRSLERLRELAAAGDQLKMSADEFDRLERTIASERAGLNFFVYMRECDAYDAGAFAHTGFYRIQFVGPPIPELKFRANCNTGQPAITTGPRARPRVAIGVIDIGIAFAHQRFRKADGTTTRLGAIWLQEIEAPDADNDVAFGTRLNAAAIDRLIAASGGDEREIYRRTGQLDFANSHTSPLARRLTHGTHVMDLAAGSDGQGPEDDDPLIFAVQLPSAMTAETSGIAMSSYILQAFRQIMVWADQVSPELPLVINFSFGNYAGPKDGYGLTERHISRLVEQRNQAGGATVAVLPAGNTYLARTTAIMNLKAGGRAASETVDWMLRPDDHTPNFLEIWLPEGSATGDDCPVDLAITPPAGPAGPHAMPKAGEASVLMQDGAPIAAVYYGLQHRDNDRARPYILVACNPTATYEPHLATAPAGPWKVEITNRTEADLAAKIYVERDDTPFAHYPRGRQSILRHPAGLTRDPETGNYDRLGDGPVTHEASLSGIGNAPNTLLIGAGQNNGPGVVPASYTSSGATETRTGPDFSAVADHSRVARGIYAAGTYSGTTARLSGTSVAAPQAARLIAAKFAADLAEGKGPLAPVDLKKLIGELARLPESIPANDPKRLGQFVIMRTRKEFGNLPARGYPQSAAAKPVA